jgi:hypothetical protein
VEQKRRLRDERHAAQADEAAQRAARAERLFQNEPRRDGRERRLHEADGDGVAQRQELQRRVVHGLLCLYMKQTLFCGLEKLHSSKVRKLSSLFPNKSTSHH